MGHVPEIHDVSPEPMYFLPDEDFVDDVLVPALKAADAFDCMVGFFDSGALSELAPGLAEYLNGHATPIRLVISPTVSAEDLAALEDGTRTAPDIITRRLREVLGSAQLDSNALARHTVLCLSYLLATRRITIRVALVAGGMFHTKIWLLTQGGETLAAHGSINMTDAALSRNIEQIGVAVSWGSEYERKTIDGLRGFFRSMWAGEPTDRYPTAQVYPLPEAIEQDLLQLRPSVSPSPRDFDVARPKRPRPEAQIPKTQTRLVLPSYLDVDVGPFQHQGKAIGAWEDAGRRGILAMATGSGKTVTAIAAAARLADTRPLLVVVAAPQRPLISMWAREVRKFSVEPLVLLDGSAHAKLKQIEAAIRRLEIGASTTEVLVCTHALLVDPRFHAALSRTGIARLLVGDEVHNLGRPQFIQQPPEFFEYRLGLSATPERQYDPDGTERLEEFFGPQVFEFGLGEAIGKCLVPFDYFVHFVDLETDEVYEWADLTAKINKLTPMQGDAKSGEAVERRLKLLRMRRRKVLETAAGKIPALAALLREKGKSLDHTLIYVTDKDPSQMEEVHAVLDEARVLYHRVTEAETSIGGLADRVLDAFERGDLRVLTAKRVLDEGINVPAIERAYVLASTTVERQWTQRLGRVLRLDPATGKTSAEYHDFVPLPAPRDATDADARDLLRGELNRVRFFGQHARNPNDANGWLTAASRITLDYFGGA